MELQFKKIEIDDIGEMMPYYTMRRNNTCDSVFLESFIWKDFYNVRYAIWEERALLWLMEYGGKCFSAMPLCREEDLPDAFRAIETYFNEDLGYPLVINLADEFAVQSLKLPEDRYYVEEQVDSRDYLYDGEAMRTLAGKKLHKKKNRVNAFVRQYEGRYEYRPLCCSDSYYIWQFLDQWRIQKGDEVEEHLDYEVKGIHDILKNCSSLNIRMGGVFIDGQLEAFTMGSYNPVENMAVIHIEKANPEINGLYQYINQQFLLEEFPEVKWVNREDDMGLEGLRKAKMSYNPADFARKYLVEQIVDGRRGFQWAEDIGNTLPGEEVTYLTGGDKEETRRLWHSCFPEDSAAFIDYYYSEKTRENRILVKKLNGLIVSMAHLNPYRVRFKGRVWDTAYIVGVATEESQRGRGHMRDLLKRMLGDMNGSCVPFTFLMPAAEEIYLPFDFATVYRRPLWRLTAAAAGSLLRIPCRETEEDCEKAAVWMNRWLGERYEVYCERDTAYVSRLLRELGSENGAMTFLDGGGELAGLEAYWGMGTGEREQRLLYAGEPYLEEVPAGDPAAAALPHRPSIMARITDVFSFLPAFSLKGDGEETFKFMLEDRWVENQAGRYRWTLTGSGSQIVKTDREAGAGLRADESLAAAQLGEAAGGESGGLWIVRIQDLASWLFGWKTAEELWPEADEALIRRLSKVDTVRGIMLDEVV